MSNDAYKVIGASILLGMLKKGLAKGSMSKHKGRVRVNFNLNKSNFSSQVSEREYIYSIYGNQEAYNASSALKDRGEDKVFISRFNKGTRTNYAESVFLKDATVWCDVTAMKAFHEALAGAMHQAESRNLSFSGSRVEYFEFVNKYMEGEHDFQRHHDGRANPPVNKSPFCFVEGDLVSSYEDFVSMLEEDGFYIESPSGIAKFNPRDIYGQPPGFVFSEIQSENDPVLPTHSLPFLIGAKYIGMVNSIATPFSPIFVWGPCLTDQTNVWNHVDKSIKKDFPAAIKKQRGTKLYINTYDLYFDTLKKCSEDLEGYTYFSGTTSLRPSHRINTEKINTLIESQDYAFDLNSIHGSMAKKKKKNRNPKRRKPIKNKSNVAFSDHDVKQKIIERARELFNKNYKNKKGTCLGWALCGYVAAKEFGKNFSILAGSSQWKFVPDNLDDGISANYFGYVFEPNSIVSRMNVASGGMPEFHAWLVDSENKQLIDFASYQFPSQAKSIAGYNWHSSLVPPKYYWVSFDEYMKDERSGKCFYRPDKDATMRYALPALIESGYLSVVGNDLVPGPNLEL